MPSGDNLEFLGEFVAEAREHLDTAEGCLLKLTKNPDDHEPVQACFRSLHTVKGGAGFMSLDRIQGLAHIAEQLLDAVREDKIKPTGDVCDALLAAVSRLRELVDAIEGGGEVGGDDHHLHERLRALLPANEPDDYTPSHAARAPAEATSRRVERHPTATTTVSLDELATELVFLPPEDAAGISALIDRLGALANNEGWSSSAQEMLARMRDLTTRLADPATRASAHAALLSQAESLAHAVLSSRLRKAAAPAIAAMAAAAPATPPLPDPPSIADFVAETNELLSKAEAVLLASAQPDASQVAELFRSFHTVKGMAAYLGHGRVEQLAHALESRLQPARDDASAFTTDLHQHALCGVDGLRALVVDLRSRGSDAGIWPAAAAACAQRLGLNVPSLPDEELPPEVPRLGDLLVQTGMVARADIEDAAKNLKPGERLGDRLVESGKVQREVVEAAVRKQNDLIAKAQGEGFARVSIARLEELVNLVGELLITQANVSQNEDVQRNPLLAITIGRQARVVRDLQALALGLRLVPLRATFQKMARAVHDTARRLDKQIELHLEGEDVEVDRTLVEAIADPLLHMVRNAVDHGIEAKAVRAGTGKPEAGLVQLTAAHSGDHVVIRLTDDGKGLDPDRLVAKAKEKGLLPTDAKPSREEAFALIFLPGFSTAEQVTGISGRGVGMDVVRRNLERVKGRIDIESELGNGTEFTIRLPLTTAILDAMVLRIANDRFLLPVTAIVEAMRPSAGEVQEVLGRGRVVQVRKQLLPVVHLGSLFSIPGAESDPTRSVLLMLEREGGAVAVQVDEIIGLQQVVIKPLEGDRPHHPGVAGAAILGDGQVGLIIDPAQLLDHPEAS